MGWGRRRGSKAKEKGAKATEIDVEALGEAEEEVERVGELVFDLFALVWIGEQLEGLVLAEETEQVEQLGGFGHRADREVFRAVELIPVALFAELAHELLQFFEGGAHC